MLEATPGKPWSINPNDLLDVESNMKWRRKIAKDHMAENEFPVTMTTFPRLGTKDQYIIPYFPPSGPMLRSQFVPDEIANPHIRFPTLAANIRSRRGRKVEINVPIYKDERTAMPFKDPTVDYELHKWPEDDDVRQGAAKENHVYMDAMAFGMGSCCLQITFQAKNILEGRKLYDQLSPLGPIMLALTASTPIYKGFLVDTDVRWNQISHAVDDRTREELGETPLKRDRWRIHKSRYASNSTYISQDSRLRPEYMDPDLVVDEKIKQKLKDGGMDELLATHFAHLFIRDPLVVFSEDLKKLDVEGSDHFENLQSTNWQHMRFKPPPPHADIGWRVEFRSMEIQMTDFENAAFSIFIVLLTRMILSYDLNLYIPIPRTTENMETAHSRDAALRSHFWFRKDPLSPPRGPHVNRSHGPDSVSSETSSATASINQNNQSESSTPDTAGTSRTGSRATSPPLGAVEDEYGLMTINQIINGGPSQAFATSSPSTITATTSTTATTFPNAKDHRARSQDFPGLLPLVESYLDSLNLTVDIRCRLRPYLELIRRRADGSVWTPARWIRHFVRTHPSYKQDSVVDEEMTYDLVRTVTEITEKEGRDGSVGWEMLRRKA